MKFIKKKKRMSQVFRIPIKHNLVAKEIYKIAIDNDADFTEVLFKLAGVGMKQFLKQKGVNI